MSTFTNRFKNFFLSETISRANLKTLAGYTLRALEAPTQPAGAPDTAALAAALRPLFEQFDVNLGAGAASLGQRQSSTLTTEAAFDSLRAYPAEAARRFILPQYAEGTPEYRQFFPQGRSAFSQATRKTIVTNMRAFIATAQQHTKQVGKEVAATAQQLLDAYLAAENQQGQAKKVTKEGRQTIEADQQALAVELFRIYGTLVAAFAAQPAQAATYFDFAMLPAKKKKPAPAL